MVDKVALAACSGMSPNGLISRVACGDCRKKNKQVISICMGSTAADIEGLNNEKIKQFPIIAVNGCDGGCVNKILKSKGIDAEDTVAVYKVLEKSDLVANDAFRLDEIGEKCVDKVKEEIEAKLNKILD
jgi:uncharacterized metal-binding protein